MKHIILAALVGVLVGGLAMAAEDDAIILHCSGWIEHAKKVRHGVARNVQIARDGSWIIWQEEKISRRKEPSSLYLFEFQHSRKWTYVFRNRITKGEERIYFKPEKMRLLHIGKDFSEMVACFPIENPLKF